MTNIIEIPIKDILPHPQNPRKHLGDLTELTASIKEKGIYQNLTVIPAQNGKYTVIIGHRRLAAAHDAGLETVPCVVTEMDEREQLQAMILENMQRQDLTLIEQAEGIQMMIDLGVSVKDISSGTGLSEKTIYRRVNLMKLDKEKLSKAMKRQATIRDYEDLNKIEDEKTRNSVLDDIGTPNFRASLQRALNEQDFRERIEEEKINAAEFAKELEGPTGWEGDGRTGKCEGKKVKLTTVYSLSTWNFRNTKEITPEEGEEYYFYATDRGFDLYKKAKPERHKKTAEELERERLTKQNKEREEMLEGITARHYALRQQFIENYAATGAKNADAIAKFTIKRLLTDSSYSRDAKIKRIAEILGIGFQEIKESEWRTSLRINEEEMNELTNAAPFKVMLVCAYVRADGESNSYFVTKGFGAYRKFYWKKNETLDAIYDLLEALGYQTSDEEQAFRDGETDLLEEASV